MKSIEYLDYSCFISVLENEFKFIKGLYINNETGMFTRHNSAVVSYLKSHETKMAHIYELKIYCSPFDNKKFLVLLQEVRSLLVQHFIQIAQYSTDDVLQASKKFDECIQ